ncbi:MAG: glycosyltransferase family 4 protein [Patescibacteria group bacterium]|nr:glycosyltransferase family 4 protein [Patescibacteria group bacterium]
MKTLIITLEYPPTTGGIASYVYNFAAHLSAEETIVYAPQAKNSKEFDLKNNWKTFRLNPYFPFFWPRWLRLFWQIRTIVKKEKIAIIHVHHALPVGYVAYFIKKFYKIPFYIFLHGTDLEYAARAGSKINKLAKICRFADKIIVNSIFLKNKLLSKIENLENIETIYPCPADFFFSSVSEEELRILKAKLALENKKVILTVARMSDGKGYPHLVRLLPKILKKIPNLVWLIIGDGPKKNIILEMIQKNNLQNAVRYLGEESYADLPKYYQLADLFALLTHKDESAEEGWGTVFLEAAASGVPVVAGRAGGVEETVENLVTGLLVDAYQDQSVISAITDLLRESEFAKKMGQAGKERVLAEYTWEKQIMKLKI